MSQSDARSAAEVNELKSVRGGAWPAIRWVRHHRPILTALLALAAVAHTLATAATPTDLLDAAVSSRELLVWSLMLLGVAVRIWGSGSLRKNREITNTGAYVLIRHPLYAGSLALFLAYFLSVGDPRFGIALFVALVGLVYYPTMLAEEEHLTLKFPTQFTTYEPPPRLLPDLRRLPEALRSDRFSWTTAYRNLGLRSAWLLLALPIFLRLLAWVE